MNDKKGLLREILLALVIGVGAGVAVMVVSGAVTALRGGGLPGALMWGRAAAVVAGGFGLVYSGILLFTSDTDRGEAFIFQFRPGKTRRTLEDELQPRETGKKLFREMPRKHAALCVSIGLLCSSLMAEVLIAVLL